MNISLSADMTDKIYAPKVFMLKDLVSASHITVHRDLRFVLPQSLCTENEWRLKV